MLNRGDYQNLEDQDEPFPMEIHSKVSWDHIQNLDKFFSNIYYFHQQHGFYVTFIEFLLQILKFFFIIWIASVLIELCFTDFEVLSGNRTNFEFFYHPIVFRSKNHFTLALVVISYLSLGLFIINSVPKLHQFYSISKFYREALKIPDEIIADKTWFEILKCLIEIQKELPLCVHKPLLTELDIYHRILRRQNYLIAMMNQEKFPTEIKIPLYGSFDFVTKYYLDSIKFMLFKFPFKCPFGDHWQLRGDYKKLGCRTYLITQLNRIFFVMGVFQLLIAPFCFFYLLITKSCTYGHSLKVSPSHCINREITPYGRIFLAHFNELPHEFAYRIGKTYPPANQYLDSFTPKILVSMARLLRFLSGGVILIGFVISMADGRFLLLPHIITIAALVTFIYAVSLKLIPDESCVVNPRLLMLEVLQHAHYIPDEWKDRAHTRLVYNEFSKLYQPKIVDILKELFSCFWSPFIFIFWMPRFSASIVDFLRNFTVEMHGVGDICSYAQADVRKHGSPAWAASVSDDPVAKAMRSESMKHGKVELSLINFYANNPNCPVDENTKKFFDNLKSIENQMVTLPVPNNFPTCTNLTNSFQTNVSTVGDKYLKNASKLVGPTNNIPNQSVIRINNESHAIDNYFCNTNIPSLVLSHNSIIVDNYKSHHFESIRDLSKSDINISIYTLHGIHERRRLGLTAAAMPVDQVISEVEEDSYQRRSLTPIDNNALNLSSIPAP